MNKIVITGHTSNMAKAFFELLNANAQNSKLEVILCGRSSDSDIQVDFSKLDSTKKFIQQINDLKPQYLWLNHGILFGKKSLEYTEQEISETLNTNMISVLLILEGIQSAENLNTVITSSISPKLGSYDQLYACTKLSCDFLIKTMATRFPSTSRLNGVSPGIVRDAKMTKVRTDTDFLENKRNLTPTKRFTNSKEVAHWVYQLLFRNHNITGENININGGLYCP